MTERIHPTDIVLWAKDAQVGDVIRYAFKAGATSFGLPAYSMETALKAHEAGLVFLSQRKDGLGGYHYEATRVSTRAARMLGIHPSTKAGPTIPWERRA